MDTPKLAALIKARRQELGLTQAEVAFRAGIEQSHVSKIERNLNVQFGTLLKLLRALDLEFEIKPIGAGQFAAPKAKNPPAVVSIPVVSAGSLLQQYAIPDDEPDEQGPDHGSDP